MSDRILVSPLLISKDRTNNKNLKLHPFLFMPKIFVKTRHGIRMSLWRATHVVHDMFAGGKDMQKMQGRSLLRYYRAQRGLIRLKYVDSKSGLKAGTKRWYGR